MTKLVIIDDHEALREGLAALLGHGGMEVVGAAGNVAAGVDLVEHTHPDVAIVDIRLPNVSGLDVIEGLKSDERTRAIPVMALTVLDSQTDRQACLDAGADVFVTKPDRIATFLDRIATLLA